MQSKLKNIQSTIAANNKKLGVAQKELLGMPPIETAPDIEAIRRQIIDASAASDMAQLKKLNIELNEAKLQLEDIEKARARHEQLQNEINTLNTENAALSAQLPLLKAEILRCEAERLGGDLVAKFDSLTADFLLVRSMAELAEESGSSRMITAISRGSMQIEIPTPIMGMSAAGRLVRNLGSDTEDFTQKARQKASPIALDLIG